MVYTKHYDSPAGGILLAGDDNGLCGLWFDGAKYFADNLPKEHRDGTNSVIDEAVCWLDIYFSGREPDFTPPLNPVGSPFRRAVWDILLEIPYGHTVTYGDIAKEIAAKLGIKRMSAQAVGGAVGHNAISIIIPCHRVVGSDSCLTGYAGGIDKKNKLLETERVDIGRFFAPKKGTAL